MNTLIVEDLNTTLSVIGRLCKQKINKETRALNDTGPNGPHRHIKNIPA